MRKLYALLLISLLPLLSGCLKTAMIVYGIKQPSIINEKKVVRGISKYGLVDGENYSLSPKGFITSVNKRESINDVLIFDKDGYRIIPRDTVTCSSDLSNLLSYYQDSTRTNRDSSYQWQTYKNGIVHLDGTPAVFDQTYDYTIVLSWATFVGRLNKTMTKERSEIVSLNKQENQNVQLLYINKDIRDYWPDTLAHNFLHPNKK